MPNVEQRINVDIEGSERQINVDHNLVEVIAAAIVQAIRNRIGTSNSDGDSNTTQDNVSQQENEIGLITQEVMNVLQERNVVHQGNRNDLIIMRSLVGLMINKIKEERKTHAQEEIAQRKLDLMHYAFPVAMFSATTASGVASQLLGQVGSPLTSKGLAQLEDLKVYLLALETSAAANVMFSLVFFLASKLHTYLNEQGPSALGQDSWWKIVTNYFKGTLTFSLFPVFAQSSQAMTTALMDAVSSGELSEEVATFFAYCITSALLTVCFKGLDLTMDWRNVFQVFFGLAGSQLAEYLMPLEGFPLTLSKATLSALTALLIGACNYENYITKLASSGVQSIGDSIGSGLNRAYTNISQRFFGNTYESNTTDESTPLLTP